MIRLEYPKANIEGLTDREKIYALKKQLDTLTNNVQLVLESIDGDIEGINEYIGGVPDELDNSMSTISERVDEVETAVGTLEERDYIVEQGTSGIWTYRKWNSGIAECWGTASGTTTCNSTWGSTMYITPALSVTFPEDLFLAPPKVTYSSASHANSSLIPFNSGSTTKSVFMFQMGRMTSIASQNYFLDIIAKGRWK